MDHDATHALLRAEQARLEHLRDQLDAPVEAEATGLAPPADAGSELAEREGRLGLRLEVEGELADVAEALARLDAGRFGTCETCGTAIDPDRLEAVPATRRCRAHEAAAERRAARQQAEATHLLSEQVAEDTLDDLALAEATDDAPRRLRSPEEAALHQIPSRP